MIIDIDSPEKQRLVEDIVSRAANLAFQLEMVKDYSAETVSVEWDGYVMHAHRELMVKLQELKELGE